MQNRVLKSLYPRVIDGVPLLGTPADAVLKFTDKKTGELKVDAMIGYYAMLSGATGFVTGLPGFLLLPIALPADLIGNAALQMHMVAALAVASGEDLSKAETRDRVFDCLLAHMGDRGKNTEDEEIAKRGAAKLGERAVRYATKRALKAVGRRVGLGRVIPLVGGILGGSSDATMTHHVGRTAEHEFLQPGSPVAAAA